MQVQWQLRKQIDTVTEDSLPLGAMGLNSTGHPQPTATRTGGGVYVASGGGNQWGFTLPGRLRVYPPRIEYFCCDSTSLESSRCGL